MHRASLATLALTITAPAQTGIWSTLPAVASGMSSVDVCYDTSRNRLVAIGRQGSTAGRYWELNGGTWQQRSGITSVSAAAVTFDSNRNRLVAVTVDGSLDVLTWAFSGSTWVGLPTATRPGRGDVELSYDSVRDRVVLYTSQIDSNASLNRCQTWEFDGNDWTLRTNGGPVPRYAHEMAFDSVRRRVVMFGGATGANSNPMLDETWEWDGSAWVEHIVTPPPTRVHYAMAFDPRLAAVVLYGGRSSSGQNRETWAWDGSAWVQIPTQGDPGDRNAAGMAFDPSRGTLVLVGGPVGATTWELSLQTPVQGTFSTFGAGCPGSAGTPVLTAFQGDRPYVNETFSLEVSNAGTSLFNIPYGVVGGSNTTWQQIPLPTSLAPFGFTGCTGYVSVDRIDSLTNSGGSVRWDIPIPNDPALASGSFYVQALILDPGATTGGAIVSNAGVGTVGLR